MKFEKLDALEQLLGCYLHQDWLDEFDSDAAALHEIVECEQKESMRAGIKEIDSLLAAELQESDLRTILLDQVGCYYDPTPAGLTYTHWLSLVRGAFAEGLARP